MNLVTIDLGAGSGRIMICEYQGGLLKYNEIHRFNNYVIGKMGYETWDIKKIIAEIIIGLKKIGEAGYTEVHSIGVDTWGVDFGLIDENGKLLQNPLHYRNKIFKEAEDKVHNLIGFDELYKRTGVQLLNFNTIYQINKIKEEFPAIYKSADKMLLIPDLIIYYLTGNYSTEYTVASTTGLLNLETKDWDMDIINKLSLNKDLFTDIIMPGNNKGKLLDEIANETGLSDCSVYAIASHDTASAVLGTPLTNNEAYISCGTWGILGVINNEPITNDVSMVNNFSNEGHFDGRIRYLKNISGFWILQETKREWEKTNNIVDYDHIARIASLSLNDSRFIDTDAEIFHHSGHMIEKINKYLFKTNQKAVNNIDELARIILESLALNFSEKCNLLESTINKKINILHIIGGGAKNEAFCQYTANSTRKVVYAGPDEATTIGNAVMQLIAMDMIKEVDVVKVINNSFNIKKYVPKKKSLWNKKNREYKKILKDYNNNK